MEEEAALQARQVAERQAQARAAAKQEAQEALELSRSRTAREDGKRRAKALKRLHRFADGEALEWSNYTGDML